jgi:aldose 1-epimerase
VTEAIEGVDVVVLFEPATGSTLHVVPPIGSNLHRFATQVADRAVEVLARAPDMATLRERSTRFGSAALFPYPGRIEGGRFAFGGRRYELPVTAPDGNAIHGVARNRAWRVLATSSDPIAGASVTTQIGTRAERIPSDEWPFSFVLTMTTRLHRGIARVEIEVENDGTETMPFGIGFHPYFPDLFGPLGSAEKTQVWVDATHAWEQAGPGLPTDRIDALGVADGLRTPRAIRDIPATVASPQGNVRNLLFHRDRAAGADGIRAGVRDSANGVHVELRASADFGALVFFTPTSPPVVSLEPHTCVPNALNVATRLPAAPSGLLTLEPGQVWNGWYEIVARAI